MMICSHNSQHKGFFHSEVIGVQAEYVITRKKQQAIALRCGGYFKFCVLYVIKILID